MKHAEVDASRRGKKLPNYSRNKSEGTHRPYIRIRSMLGTLVGGVSAMMLRRYETGSELRLGRERETWRSSAKILDGMKERKKKGQAVPLGGGGQASTPLLLFLGRCRVQV